MSGIDEEAELELRRVNCFHDRTFYNIGAINSMDRLILCSADTPMDGLCDSKIRIF